MIIVTGGAGFIGSNIIKALNKSGETNIMIVDELDNSEKWKNLRDLRYGRFLDKNNFFDVMEKYSYNRNEDTIVIHMGACSNTMEKDSKYIMDNNYNFSVRLFQFCCKHNARFIYASSAAVYGDGKLGYSDLETDEYIPLNMYGYSKKSFDQYVESRLDDPPQVVGLRFFNVYGPNEAHKGQMASVIYHLYHQIKGTGKAKLFKSNRLDIKHGDQSRDFIYIKDVVDIVLWFITRRVSGIFNVGTGKARTYMDVALTVFSVMGKKQFIHWIDMPEGLKEKYQYHTEANMKQLRAEGYSKRFTSLEDGVADYIKILEAK